MMFRSLLVGLVTLLAAPAAFACGNVDYDQKVVGYSSDGTRALVRLEESGHDPEEGGDHLVLSLFLLDLPTGRVVERWPILHAREQGNERVRGQRWREAERAITALGVTVQPHLVPLGERNLQGGPWELPSGVKVHASNWCDDDGRTYVLYLRSPTGHEQEVELGKTDCSGNGQLFFGPMYLSPGGRWLVVPGDGRGEALIPSVVPVEVSEG